MDKIINFGSPFGSPRLLASLTFRDLNRSLKFSPLASLKLLTREASLGQTATSPSQGLGPVRRHDHAGLCTVADMAAQPTGG